MPEFKIYLVDYTASADFTTNKKTLLANRLKNLFESVCAGHTDYTVSVLWQFPTGELSNELVCYYVLNRNKSIIKAKYHNGPGTDGFTRFSSGDGSLSEIYYTNWARFPTFLADLTFHEFMHNKLDGGSAAINVHDDTSGFGQSVLNNDQSDIDNDDPATPDDERLIHHYQLTSGNVSNMFSALSSNVRQVLVTQEEFNRLMRPRSSQRRAH